MGIEVSGGIVVDGLARMLKALGDATRLRLFICLLENQAVAVGEGGNCTPGAGPTMGQVCCKVTGSEQIS